MCTGSVPCLLFKGHVQRGEEGYKCSVVGQVVSAQSLKMLQNWSAGLASQQGASCMLCRILSLLHLVSIQIKKH